MAVARAAALMRWQSWRGTRADWRRMFRRRLAVWLANQGLPARDAGALADRWYPALARVLARLRRRHPAWAARHGAHLRQRRGRMV